jgi:hypothetical protein
LDAYPQWNPFIPKARGETKNGEKLEVHIQPPNTRGMIFKPKVIKAEQNHELRWLGRLFIPRLFDGEHIFTIEPLKDKRSRFIQREILTGLLVPFFLMRSLEVNTRLGFEDMNTALKKQAEH